MGTEADLKTLLFLLGFKKEKVTKPVLYSYWTLTNNKIDVSKNVYYKDKPTYTIDCFDGNAKLAISLEEVFEIIDNLEEK